MSALQGEGSGPPLVAYVTHDSAADCQSPVPCTQTAHLRVTDWHGARIGIAVRSTDYHSTFGHVRAVTVLMGGHTWHGRYGPDWSEAVTLWRSRNS